MSKNTLAALMESGAADIKKNFLPAKLVELALERGEGTLAANGALAVQTGERTGRSPNDRFIAYEKWAEKHVWWGAVNKSISPEIFNSLLAKATEYLKNRERFVFDGFVGADPIYRMAVRVITERAWHALFATTLFIRPSDGEEERVNPEFTLVSAPGLKLDPAEYGIHSGTFVGISFEKKIILTIGTGYGGEIKKSFFSVMNGILPDRNVLPMHCSANVGPDGDTALFFGLSGTGKTTLSADPARRLIGDDEHGWSFGGIFNLEGGCYAKVIRISKESEPQIFNAIKFGSILENVIIDPKTLAIDYSASTITENTRATYPVEHIPNCVIPSVGRHPNHIFFLTSDAFGVLPPIAKLTPEMAMYHFLSGYTAKLAGVEVGINEPQATFSACFGAPFLPLHPAVYAKLLGERISEHNTKCWLVNSGWSGGPYGEGKRMDISITRALISAALKGTIEALCHTPDPVFNIFIPNSCPGVPSKILAPRNTWQDKDAYDKKARELADRFRKNFAQYAEYAGKKIMSAGPRY